MVSQEPKRIDSIKLVNTVPETRSSVPESFQPQKVRMRNDKNKTVRKHLEPAGQNVKDKMLRPPLHRTHSVLLLHLVHSSPHTTHSPPSRKNPSLHPTRLVCLPPVQASRMSLKMLPSSHARQCVVLHRTHPAPHAAHVACFPALCSIRWCSPHVMQTPRSSVHASTPAASSLL